MLANEPVFMNRADTKRGCVATASSGLDAAVPACLVADHRKAPERRSGRGAARGSSAEVIEPARARGAWFVPLAPVARGEKSKRQEAVSDVIQW